MGFALALRHGGVSRIPSRGYKIHPATKFTPYYLVLGREVRAAVDLVYDAPETSAPVSYASYADEMGDRMREAYALVREHLKVAAERKGCAPISTKWATGFTTLTHES